MVKLADVTTIRKDVRDTVVEDLVGFDGVLHLAALSNDPLGNLKPGLTDEINHRASVRIATLAKEQASAVSYSPPLAATMVRQAKQWLTRPAPLIRLLLMANQR